MLKPFRTAAPDSTKPLLTVAECKSFMRIDFTDEDDTITGLIATATDSLDQYAGTLGRCLINQTWRLNFANWPDCNIRLPFAPVQSITSIKYYDTANSQQTVTNTNYNLYEDALSPFVKFISTYAHPALYDREDAIEVLFVAGYGADATFVPAPIKHAAKMSVAYWFEHRDEEGKLPEPARHLIAPFRRIGP